MSQKPSPEAFHNCSVFISCPECRCASESEAVGFQISRFLPHGSGGFHQEGTDGFAADRSSFIITEEWLAFFDASLVSIWKAYKNVAGSLNGAKI